jgi:tyrosyl-tRNA synthetase
VPLLVGTDGVEKMSKSLGNAIALEDSARDMYGRTMSLPDGPMWDWYVLLTDLALAEIERKKRDVQEGTLHPKAAKQELARRITAEFHGEAAAAEAEAEFAKVHGGGGVPDEVEERELAGTWGLGKLLAAAGLAASNAEARRLIGQGAVAIDGERATDPNRELPPRAEPYSFKVGKRRFARVRLR